MESRDVEKLNIDLLRIFGWQVEIAEQDESLGVSGKYLRLYRVSRPGQPDCKKSYVGPIPIDITNQPVAIPEYRKKFGPPNPGALKLSRPPATPPQASAPWIPSETLPFQCIFLC